MKNLQNKNLSLQNSSKNKSTHNCPWLLKKSRTICHQLLSGIKKLLMNQKLSIWDLSLDWTLEHLPASFSLHLDVQLGIPDWGWCYQQIRVPQKIVPVSTGQSRSNHIFHFIHHPKVMFDADFFCLFLFFIFVA